MDFKQPVWNYERDPDETSFNPAWPDEEVMAWDGNFKDGGTLLLACSERDLEAEEFRRVALQCLGCRERVRPQLAADAR